MKISRLIYPFVVACAISVVNSVADEASALSVLAATNSTANARAVACDELGRVGTATAVPTLAKLLADASLNDYARDALERIPDPAAGKALVDALDTLEGDLRIGVIITLGDRREKTALPALTKIAKGNGDPQATYAALAALAQIATPDAGKTLLAVLAKSEGDTKVSAARAALLAARQMEKEDQQQMAKKLRKAVANAEVPAYLKQAAGR